LVGIRECANKTRVYISEGLSVAMCVRDPKSVDLGISRWIRSFEESGDVCARCQIRIWLWCSTKGSMVLAVSWTPPFVSQQCFLPRQIKDLETLEKKRKPKLI
jgi:hypothetical protein